MTVRRPPVPGGRRLSLVGVVGCAVLTGCTGGGDGGSGPASAPTPSPTTTAATTGATPPYALPTSCSALLTLSQIDAALGSRLPGETTYTVGTAEPSIARTGRVTCGFGVVPATDTAGAGSPLLELSVFTYTDAGAAAGRVADTVEAQQARGVRSEDASVPGADAVLLTAADGATLIATVEARTYSLSLVPGILDAAVTAPALQQLMSAVLAADGPTEATSTPPTTTGSTGSSAPTG
jgi:hypothetical protein